MKSKNTIRKQKGSILGKREYYGLYRAKVEDNCDPSNTGRVRIRIPSMHGIPNIDPTYIDTQDLPWASYGASVEGSYIIPDVGSFVYIMFEAGDPNKPVYVGGCYGTNSAEEATIKSTSDSSGSYSWNTATNSSNIPDDAISNNDKFPQSTKVIYQSPKGASISINEESGKESFKITDRLGQSIEMIGGLPEVGGTITRRNGNNRHSSGNGINTNSGAEMLITDASGQSIRMSSGSCGSDSSISICSPNNNVELSLSKQGILLKNGDGYKIAINDGRIRITTLEEDKYIELDNELGVKLDNGKQSIAVSIKEDNITMKSSECSIKINDEGNYIKADGNWIHVTNDGIVIHSSSELQLDVSNLTLNGNLRVNGNISGRETSK